MATPSVSPAPARHLARAALWVAVAVLALSGCGPTTTATPVAPTVKAAAGKATTSAAKSATATRQASARKAAARKAAARKAAARKAAARKAAAASKVAAPTMETAGLPPGMRPSTTSTLITDGPSHFTVRLPAGYTRLTKARVKSLGEAGVAAMPQYKAILDQYLSLGDRARLFAYKTPVNGVGGNVNIAAFPAAGVTAGALEKGYDTALKPALKQLGATITAHKVTKVAGAKAFRIDYRLTAAAQRVRGTQVYIPYRGKLLIVTVTQGDVGASTPQATAILRGLRLT
jgi:hypothetical protein